MDGALRLSILRVIMNTAVGELELEKNPILGAKMLDATLHPTYTEEEPNSLTSEEAKAFLAEMRKTWPQFFAMTALGFATGLRPSSLRPLRRKGATPDMLWEPGVLLVRRSHTRKTEVMETTKTKKHLRISLPQELVDILRWHVAELPERIKERSDLLFPSVRAGFHAPNVLEEPFRDVAKTIGLKKHITPRAMRRTFQDLAREAQVKDVVTRAISGHATEEMQLHYSTVSQEEIRVGLAKVIQLAGYRELAAKAAGTEADQQPGGEAVVAEPAEGRADSSGAASGVQGGVRG